MYIECSFLHSLYKWNIHCIMSRKKIYLTDPVKTIWYWIYFETNFTIKGGVSNFWKPMLTFEITKTNTPQPQKGLAPILIAPPYTYVAYATQAIISSLKQSKTNVTPCLHRTRAARQNTVEVIIISDAVYTGCCAVRQDKSPTVNCCCILFMMCWHKFLMIFNGCFVTSSVDRLKCCGAARLV